ncbi:MULTISPECIES: hypothetical protein [Chryseobacterium]|jgi:hypothetical protein|uniref:Uncharacterized protein n=1 Tax=Chryseobacterium scophthalmum TaxID=59733 RepID=A0A1N6HJH3_9FLAO|nr:MULTISPECIES: hypothetical protein [Chryseobacterium]MBM7418022.1 hypothetical protein [Chryseobacterium sp. JUb44]MDH6212224.1 hypothetical protein [Chryseobacterium sp. BIGb0186]WSO10839.1 hypothetical protein VUJ64_02705 [Chryseobacterium scophthalmum]SIO19910.1 hypothetical protein SAMN05421769_2578 [Chryseobacterium scophthalmum]
MDIQSRKLEFIQDFLKLQSEEVIAQFEKLLKKAKNIEEENKLEKLTIEEMNERISKSEDDFENKKFKTTSELLSKYSN